MHRIEIDMHEITVQSVTCHLEGPIGFFVINCNIRLLEVKSFMTDPTK